MGWDGNTGLLADIAEWIQKCRPDSIDDIQSVWREHVFYNYEAAIYCKVGDGDLKPIRIYHIPWAAPEKSQDNKITDRNKLLRVALKDVAFRVIGLYQGRDSSDLYLIAAGPNCDKLAEGANGENTAGIITSGSQPKEHHPPESGTWGVYLFTWEDATQLGWNGEQGLLRDLDDWIRQCQPDSIDDIQAVWDNSGATNNYMAAIYCKAGRGSLKPVRSFDTPWQLPLYTGGEDLNEIFQLALREVSFRVVGLYDSYAAQPPRNQIYMITAGPNCDRLVEEAERKKKGG